MSKNRSGSRRSGARATRTDRGESRGEIVPPRPVPDSPGLGWVGLLAVGALAVAARLVVAQQLGHTVLYRMPQLDALEFLEWAKRIAAGHFSLPSFPTHGPIYPFFLGGALALFGGSLRAVRFLQAFVGAGTCVLTADLAARLWKDRRAGIVTGVLLALYGPLAFVDTELWEEGLFLLFLVLALWMLEARELNLVRAGAAGLCLGLACAIRPTALLLLPLWALAQLLGRRPRRGQAILALTLGTMLVFAPIVAAASRAAGTFLLVRGFGTVNVWIGNDPQSGGIQNKRLGGNWERVKNEPVRAGLTDPSELERYFLHQSLRRARQDPAGFLRVQASKLVWLTQAEEPRDNHSFYFFREQSSLLGLLPGFGLLFGLTAAGVMALWRRRIVPWYLVAVVVSTAASIALALVGLRYRLPIAPALAAVAGGGAIALWDEARARHIKRAAALAAAALVAAAISHLRHHPPTHSFAEEWALSGSSLETSGSLDEAEGAYRRSIELDPSSAMGWDGIARVRLRQGRDSEAEAALRESIARDPDYVRSHYHLGEVLLQHQQTQAGLQELRTALEIAPHYTPAVRTLAQQLLARGSPQEAEPLFQRLTVLEPRDPAGWEGLAQVEGALNRAAQGVTAARRATELAPEQASAWQLLGFLAVQVPDLTTAREALEHLETLGGNQSSRLLLAAAVDHLSGNWGAADQILRGLLSAHPRFAAARELLLRNAEKMGRLREAEGFLRGLKP